MGVALSGGNPSTCSISSSRRARGSASRLDGRGGVDHIPAVVSVMTPFPHYVELDDPIRRARELMLAHEVRHLPVLRGHTLVGILTDRDLKRSLDPDLGLSPRDELFVRDIYRPEPYVVDASTPLDSVLEHMAAHHFGSVLVTKHGRLAGILTATDVCRVYCGHLRKLFPQRSGGHVA
jgi:CBS domain-containing protein